MPAAASSSTTMGYPRRHHHHLLPPLLLILALATLFHCTFAFLPHMPTTGLASVSSVANIAATTTTTTTTFRRASVVVAMAKGRKADKKRKTSTPKQPPQQQQQPSEASSSSSSPSDSTTTTTTTNDNTEGYSILGSSGPLSSTPDSKKGFGAPATKGGKPSIDEAYERALSKIKGQDNLSASPLGGGGAQQLGGPAPPDGKVPVRNVDIFDFIPESVQSAFEFGLIGGLALNLLVIIVIGIIFSLEALPTSNLDLPESLSTISKEIQPLVAKVEGLFTPALGVFFLLSTLLGSFKIAQLSRGQTTYVEKGSLDKGRRGRK